MSGIRNAALLVCVFLLTGPGSARAQFNERAARTRYPVVFAHGLGGFDNLLGNPYFGDDLGTFVGDACDEPFELVCNAYLNAGQRAHGAQVAPFESSEVRGLQLADEIEGVLATTGATRVNLVGHSQGGSDSLKAARVLYMRKRRVVVDVLVSISSPLRGSPVARYVLDTGPTVTELAGILAKLYGDAVYDEDSDPIAAVKQLVYDDYDPNDGITTGSKAFNAANPMDPRHASHYASVLTAQFGVNLNPSFLAVQQLFVDIDGDGYCVDDCDNDGAAGRGDGIRDERDDDGVVGINSQQMGHRLTYTPVAHPLRMDTLVRDTTVGPVTRLNAPGPEQMTSMSSVIDQDHLDVVGFGPDLFNEKKFYAALIHYISQNE